MVFINIMQSQNQSHYQFQPWVHTLSQSQIQSHPSSLPRSLSNLEKYMIFLNRMRLLKEDAIFYCDCAKEQKERENFEKNEQMERIKKEIMESYERCELYNEIYFKIFFLKNKKKINPQIYSIPNA